MIMRMIAGLFGLLCGSILVAMVAWFAYKTSDGHVDGLLSAFMFGAITTVGLFGHPFAVRLWRLRSYGASIAVGAIVMLALVVSLSNSLGAIASRGDTTTAERSKSAQALVDDRAELKRVTHERETMPAFQPATADAVTAARDAVAAAERVTKAECEKRGTNCRTRETEETLRRGELTQILKERAATERAMQLDAEIAKLRQRLEHGKAVGAVNPQALMIARVLRLPEAETARAMYYQSLAVAIVVDLLVVAAVIFFEVTADVKTAATPAPQAPPPVEGAPERFFAEALRRKRGKRLLGAPVYPAYQAWCSRMGFAAVGDADFVERFFSACERAGIRSELRDGEVVLADVELAA